MTGRRVTERDGWQHLSIRMVGPAGSALGLHVLARFFFIFRGGGEGILICRLNIIS